MSLLRLRTWLRRSRRALVLVCVLVALSGVDLVHHAAADASSHGSAAVCVAVLEGFALTASVVVAAALALPRPRFGPVAAPPSSTVAAAPPAASARAGPLAPAVLRL
jgi:hypothetical protein